jgi:hypothetical protein
VGAAWDKAGEGPPRGNCGVTRSTYELIVVASRSLSGGGDLVKIVTFSPESTIRNADQLYRWMRRFIKVVDQGSEKTG